MGAVNSGGLQAVLQAAVGNGLSFDPFSFCQKYPTPAQKGAVKDC